MKKILLITIFLLASIIQIFAQGKIFYDIKIPIQDKIKLAHIETILAKKLLDSDFAIVSEGVADYAIWLKNYEKEQDQNVFEVFLDIEVRKSKLFGEGDLVLSDKINLKYVIGLKNDEANTHYEYFKQKYDNWSEEKRTEAIEVSKELYEKIQEITLRLNDYR